MFNQESFISIEKCLILTDLEIPNPCNEIDQENYTSKIILSNTVKLDFKELFGHHKKVP